MDFLLSCPLGLSPFYALHRWLARRGLAVLSGLCTLARCYAWLDRSCRCCHVYLRTCCCDGRYVLVLLLSHYVGFYVYTWFLRLHVIWLYGCLSYYMYMHTTSGALPSNVYLGHRKSGDDPLLRQAWSPGVPPPPLPRPVRAAGTGSYRRARRRRRRRRSVACPGPGGQAGSARLLAGACEPWTCALCALQARCGGSSK